MLLKNFRFALALGFMLLSFTTNAQAAIPAVSWDEVMNNGILESREFVEKLIGKADEVVKDAPIGDADYYDILSADGGVERGFVYYEEGKAALVGQVFVPAVSTKEMVSGMKAAMATAGFSVEVDEELALHMKATDMTTGASVYLVVEEGDGGGYPVMYFMTEPVYKKVTQE